MLMFFIWFCIIYFGIGVLFTASMLFHMLMNAATSRYARMEMPEWYKWPFMIFFFVTCWPFMIILALS